MKTLKRLFICICTVFLFGLVSCSKSPADEYFDKIEAISKEAQTLVEQVQNNEISYPKFINAYTKCMKELEIISSDNDIQINIEDLSTRQRERFQKIMSDLEKTADIATHIHY